jgi:hypothetical protein
MGENDQALRVRRDGKQAIEQCFADRHLKRAHCAASLLVLHQMCS